MNQMSMFAESDLAEMASEMSISSSVGLPAKVLPSQVSALVRAIRDGDGRSLSALWATVGHGGSSQKIQLESSASLVENPGGSSSENLPRWAIVSGGVCTALMPWGRPTGVIVSSSPDTGLGSAKPTPMVPNGGRMPKDGAMSPTGMTPDGKKRQVDLNWAVKEVWPTPISQQFGTKDMGKLLARRQQLADKYGNNGFGLILEAAVKLEPVGGSRPWPTPTSSDHTGPGHASKGGPNLRTVVAQESARWPTPVVNDAKNIASSPSQRNRKSPGLATAATPIPGLWSPPQARDGRCCRG